MNMGMYRMQFDSLTTGMHMHKKRVPLSKQKNESLISFVRDPSLILGFIMPPEGLTK